MTKLNISVSTSYLRLTALLFVFIIYVSAKNVDTISNYQYDDDNNNNNGEGKLLLPADILFFLNNMNSQPGSSSTTSDYDVQSIQEPMIPFKKRTIPIELQKALYAHGIVGRRRR